MLFRITTMLLALVGAVHSQGVGELCLDQKTNRVGMCTPAIKCLSARNDYTQYGTLPTVCSYSQDNPIVCCRDGNTIVNTMPYTSDSKTNGDRRRVSERKCEEYSQTVTETVEYIPLLPDPDMFYLSTSKCTYTSAQFNEEEAAMQGEFPHMAAIGWMELDSYVFNCAGSLISPRFVLSAGHCTWDPQANKPLPSIVRLGDHVIDPTVDDNAYPTNVPIKKIHKHPNYKPPKRYDDIALFELYRDVAFTTWIRPACLWNRFDFGEHVQAIATGWGFKNIQTQEKELQKISLLLLNNSYCDPLLKNFWNRNWHGLDDTQMCVKELFGQKKTCQGDSGSPLQVVSTENECVFHIVGIEMFSQNCTASQPAIYTRVFKYLNWIESIVWPGE